MAKAFDYRICTVINDHVAAVDNEYVGEGKFDKIQDSLAGWLSPRLAVPENGWRRRLGVGRGNSGRANRVAGHQGKNGVPVPQAGTRLAASRYCTPVRCFRNAYIRSQFRWVGGTEQ